MSLPVIVGTSLILSKILVHITVDDLEGSNVYSASDNIIS